MRWWFPYLLSIGLHSLLIVLWLCAIPDVANKYRLLSRSLNVELPRQDVLTGGGVVPLIPLARSEAVRGPVFKGEPEGADELPMVFERAREGLVHEVGELDSDFRVESELEVEPAYGYADDIKGGVDVSVLVSPEGRAVMVWYGATSLDAASLSFLTYSIRLAKFSAPRKNGLPTYAVFRIRVEIGSPGL